MRQSGIYAIENTINKKRYYGSTKDKRERWSQHRRQLNKGIHHNRHLQSAWNKYGKEAFEFIWIKDVPVEQLLDVEQKYLDANGGGYNISKYADAPTRGLKMSAETCRKLSEIKMGHTTSTITRRKISEAHEGKRLSQSHRQKLSDAKIGKPLSEEHRQILAQVNRLNPPHLGIKHSEETRRKMSEAHKGKPLSEQHRRKIGEAVKGNTNSLGKHHSDESRRKMSERRKGRIPWNKGITQSIINKV